jgi:transcriptional regulator with XRE-family HTH domain
MTLATKIRELREKTQLSQTKLAERVGITQAIITQIESGKTSDPGISAVLKLSRYFGIPMEVLSDDELTLRSHKKAQNASLDPKVKMLVSLFKAVGDDDQDFILKLIHMVVNRLVEP